MIKEHHAFRLPSAYIGAENKNNNENFLKGYEVLQRAGQTHGKRNPKQFAKEQYRS